MSVDAFCHTDYIPPEDLLENILTSVCIYLRQHTQVARAWGW